MRDTTHMPRSLRDPLPTIARGATAAAPRETRRRRRGARRAVIARRERRHWEAPSGTVLGGARREPRRRDRVHKHEVELADVSTVCAREREARIDADSGRDRQLRPLHEPPPKARTRWRLRLSRARRSCERPAGLWRAVERTRIEVADDDQRCTSRTSGVRCRRDVLVELAVLSRSSIQSPVHGQHPNLGRKRREDDEKRVRVFESWLSRTATNSPRTNVASPRVPRRTSLRSTAKPSMAMSLAGPSVVSCTARTSSRAPTNRATARRRRGSRRQPPR